MSECKPCENRTRSTLKCFSRMNNTFGYKVYPRVYVQYNELVFSGIESVQSADLSGDFKLETTPYVFRHGSYYDSSVKRSGLLMGEQDLSLDLKLPFSKLTRIQALDYAHFIKAQLSKPGVIWAFDTGGRLIWAYALPKHPPYDDYEIRNGHYLQYSMDFLLPEGVWHVANTDNVFLEPYDLCDFKNECSTGYDYDCTTVHPPVNVTSDVCCDLEEEMHYCNTCWNPYDQCNNPYRIVYSCNTARKMFGWKTWGEQFIECDSKVVTTFGTNAIYDSPVTITLLGIFKNPTVLVNNRQISISGTYDGRLVITPDKGKVYFYPDEPHHEIQPCAEQIPYSKITYHDTEVRFTAKRGRNELIVEHFGDSVFNMVYVSVDELTT